MEERQRNRIVYGLMISFVAVLAAVSLFFVLRTVIYNKLDYSENEVGKLLCTFRRLPFHVESVICNTTGKRLTIVEIMFDSESYRYYTPAGLHFFADVGWVCYDSERILAFSREELKDGVDYVVDYGRIVYLDIYGRSESVRTMVNIEAIHEAEQFDNIVSGNMLILSILLSFCMAMTCCLFFLPIIEYYVNPEIEKKKHPNQLSSARRSST